MARRTAPRIPDALLDQLLAGADPKTAFDTNGLLDDLKKKPDDLRQKMLFDFRSFTAVSFDVTHGGQTFSFVKQKPAAAPDSSPAPAA